MFHICDTIGIKAFHNVMNVVRNFNLFFGYDFEIFNFDKGCGWSYKRYFVDFVGMEVGIAYLDNSLFAIFLAIEVIAKKNLVFIIFEVQDVQYLENIVGGNMIDNRAVFDGGYI